MPLFSFRSASKLLEKQKFKINPNNGSIWGFALLAKPDSIENSKSKETPDSGNCSSMNSSANETYEIQVENFNATVDQILQILRKVLCLDVSQSQNSMTDKSKSDDEMSDDAPPSSKKRRFNSETEFTYHCHPKYQNLDQILTGRRKIRRKIQWSGIFFTKVKITKIKIKQNIGLLV